MSESDVQFIPKADFKEKCVSWENFQQMASQRGVKVIDARDSVQKGFMSQADEDALSEKAQERLQKFRTANKEMLDAVSGNGRVLAQSFDMLQRNVIGNKRYRNQTLLIFDQVGKQVRWLMYHLEVAGMKDYYFLDKGANGVIGIQAYGKM